MMPPNARRESDGAWIDLMRARRFEQRVVLVNGDLDDVLAGGVATELMTLDACGDLPVRLLLNSGAGTFAAAFTVIVSPAPLALIVVAAEPVVMLMALSAALLVATARYRQRTETSASFRLHLATLNVSVCVRSTVGLVRLRNRE